MTIDENGVVYNVNKQDMEKYYSNPEQFWAGIKELAPFSFTNSGAKSLVIPNTVKRIQSRAFHSAKHLEKIVLPEGLKEIEKDTFRWCWSLKEVYIPKSVLKIGDNAFAACESLVNVDIPEGVEEIGDYVFFHCHLLEKSVIPASVKKVGGNIFTGCGRIKEVYFLGNPDVKADTTAGLRDGVKVYLRCQEEQEAGL